MFYGFGILNFLKGTDFDTKKLKKQVQKGVVEFRQIIQKAFHQKMEGFLDKKC